MSAVNNNTSTAAYILFLLQKEKATPRSPYIFRQNEAIEVMSTEEGFVGSYYEATVVRGVGRGDYIVRYANLVKDDFSGPLTEVVATSQIRPIAPTFREGNFREGEVVDAFDNDGWWVGRITGRAGKKYRVFFDSTGDEIWYPIGRLRIHHDWVGEWTCERNLYL